MSALQEEEWKVDFERSPIDGKLTGRVLTYSMEYKIPRSCPSSPLKSGACMSDER